MSGVYYFDVLPLRPQPERLESLTSYLTRLAAANQLRSMSQLFQLSYPHEHPRLNIANRDFPPVSFGALPTVAQCAEADLLTTTFFHLGRKFGRSPYAQGLTMFLAGVLARPLRYCPLCLTAHGYYRLTWRFLTIEGCSEHSCRLLDRCGHCAQPIPLLTYHPQVGICPACWGDLRTCPVEFLAEPQRVRVKTRTREFEYLLWPQTCERAEERILAAIGAQFARWREGQGLSTADVARAMKQYPSIFSYLEKGTWPRGLGLRQYLNYADFLQISLPDIFETAAPPPPTLAQSYEEKTLTKIQQAVVTLEQQRQRVTQTKVKQMIGVNMAVFTKYPRIKAFWAEYKARVRQQWEQEMLNQVQQAITRLQQQGQRVTKTAVSQMVGQDPVNLQYHYPTIWAVIASHSQSEAMARPRLAQNKPPDDQGRTYRREAELIDKVQQAIAQLQREGKLVSQYAIADRVGMSTDGLIYYPQVRAILRANKADPPHRDEEALLARVREAVADLKASSARVSRTAVARQVGLSACTLTYYPLIKSFLSEEVTRYQQRQTEQHRQRETELVFQVQQAIEMLTVRGNHVTKKAIAELVGVSTAHLRQYPRIKSLLQPVTQQGGSIRLSSAQT